MESAGGNRGGNTSSGDEAYAYLETQRQPLDVFFEPRAVAVIGASDKAGSVGRKILWNLISSPFGGTVYAVNPSRHNVLGIRAYPDVASLPEPIDLAMVLTPAATVPGLIRECGEAGIKGAIIISAGFKETGEPGRALEEQIRAEAERGKIRVIGPNSLGLMNPVTGLNAAYASGIAHKGSVGFISQSGALCAAILDWSFKAKVGFSAFVSFGSMVDVGWADLIYHLGNDPDTKSIVIFMQSAGDARSFLSAVREVALTKPIILLRSGQTLEAARVARTTPYYAASDVCSDDVLSAALRRSGVLRVHDIESLFSMAEVLAKQPRPKGPRLTIISNAAGPGILATDALINGGGELAELSEETMAELNALLPSYWNRSNPIDIQANAGPDRYASAVEAAVRDKNTDGLLVVLTPQVMAAPTETAEKIASLEGLGRKPVLASWMGGDNVAAGEAILNSCNIPTLRYPDDAARVFSAMWRYSYNLKGLYETPTPLHGREEDAPEQAEAGNIIQAALSKGDTTLTETKSKHVLAAYGIPVADTRCASDEDEAVYIAEEMGYPVVLKLDQTPMDRPLPDPDTHVSLATEGMVRQAYQALEALASETGCRGITVRPMIATRGYRLVIGSMVDPQFGPILYFGSGGPLGDVIHDRALGLPPLNSTLAFRIMEQTRILSALKNGGPGRQAVDLEQLARILVRFSYLVAEQRQIREIAINPFLATHREMEALDARVVLYGRDTDLETLPRLAIRPYPGEYVTTCMMKNGQNVTLRPIRPEDESLMIHFHETLSKDTVYFRFLRILAFDQRVKHERLARMCFIDYDRGMAIVAVQEDPETREERILGVSRMVKLHGRPDADFAIVVGDAFHGQGLGQALLRRLAEVARAEKVRRLVGVVLPENRAMLRLCAKLGFRLHKPLGGDVIAELDL